MIGHKNRNRENGKNTVVQGMYESLVLNKMQEDAKENNEVEYTHPQKQKQQIHENGKWKSMLPGSRM